MGYILYLAAVFLLPLVYKKIYEAQCTDYTWIRTLCKYKSGSHGLGRHMVNTDVNKDCYYRDSLCQLRLKQVLVCATTFSCTLGMYMYMYTCTA